MSSTIDLLRITAETVLEPTASTEESERIMAWLERPDTRLVQMSAGWASPIRGAARFRDLLIRAEKAASGKDSTESS